MSVWHIVQFRFKADASPEAVKHACAGMTDLKLSCIHPDTQKPYIKSLTGGSDNSPEGHQNGIQYAFIVEFENLGDRDYYVKRDPAHQDFVKAAGPIIEKVIVVDYKDGVFE